MGTVSSVIVSNVLAALRESGAPAGHVLGELGIDPATLDDPDARFGVATAERLWEIAPAESGDDAFGLHAAERRARGSHGVVEFWIGASPRFHEGLERFCRFYRLLSDMATLEMVIDDRAARLSLRLSDPERLRHAAEYFAGVVVTVVRRMLGRPVLPTTVAFAHAAPADIREHQRLFMVRPRFGAQMTEIAFDASLLREPLVTADAALAHVLEPVVSSALAKLPPPDDALERIRAAAVLTLRAGGGAEGPRGLRKLAKALGTSPRSLQRTLASHRSSYQLLIDDVRRELALRYLGEGRLSIHEIAFFLGFSQVSAFHRAFKRWTATTPKAYRAEHEQHDAGAR